MLTALRTQLAALLDACQVRRKPALRRSLSPHALFSTDLPLAAEETAVAVFMQSAQAQGWFVTREGDWLQLDHPLPPPPVLPVPPCAGYAGCALSLLMRHPGDDACTADELRALCKAAESGPSALEKLCRVLCRDWAARLRRHEPLPSGLLPYLVQAVHTLRFRRSLP